MSYKIKVMFVILFCIFLIFITGKSVNAQEFMQTRNLDFRDGDYVVVDVPNDMLTSLTRYRFHMGYISSTEINTSQGRWLESANVYCVQHPNDIGSNYHIHSQYIVRLGWYC